jgi:2-polyprenyl-3-methyl-5-hydroxy-6-metoxy-1,4-benzoquinol methylase
MAETTYADEYLAYQTQRSWVRKLIRKVYLWQVRRHVVGNAIDFGCGAGEHLATFSKESIGLEVNKVTVDYCRQNGLNVEWYNPEEDDYQLKQIPTGKYQTLVISHVLEHLEKPEYILLKLMEACKQKGIERIFICLPCKAGFAHDKTHITFVTRAYIAQHQLEQTSHFSLTQWGYFPLNMQWVGDFFIYNELYLMYEAR